MPETLNLATDVIHAVAPDSMSDLGQSPHISLGVQYSDIEQRWVVVYTFNGGILNLHRNKR
ncbi:MAG: hypothetical protein BECKG1743D_GA0114223_106923 [Candidatus Kentron sp. G]|nr:MAG: hypothetical protein BECKG1743E_GA0114224_106793 [Candidatus Kentron sp. G]VFN05249.1 MAG: hypothetical protein BECKG1743D_GA0114223_106923 [Candidatus Kentron sp. G]